MNETILIVVFPKKLPKKEKDEWKKNLASLTDFNDKVAVRFFDKRDEAIYALHGEFPSEKGKEEEV